MILYVLLQGDNYGYQMIKDIYQRSGRRFELKEPTLYSSLRRLEKQRLIESYWGEAIQGGRRKYYRITDAGRIIYIANCEAWITTRDLIDQFIDDGQGADSV